MAILYRNNEYHFCRLSLPLSEFPDLLQRHADLNPDTLNIEKQAAEMVRSDFQWSNVEAFVKAVCIWGDYAGIWGRVLPPANEQSDIISALRHACELSEAGEVVKGLQLICDLKGLGVSFATKHLRFLTPDKAVTLDSYISTHLGYPMDMAGYEDFLKDCHTLKMNLNESKTTNSLRPNLPWMLSDVEMAIYIKLSQ